MKTPCAASAWTANARTATWFSSVTCATWQFTKNVTAFLISQKANGFAVVASSHLPELLIALCVPIEEALLNRLMTTAGLMSYAPCGFLKSVSPIRCSSSPLTVSTTFQLPGGSSRVTSASNEVLVLVSSVTGPIVTLLSTSPALNRLI